MEAQKDFKELLELLNEQKVKYIIVGGYALAFHGEEISFQARRGFKLR
jgi:hypothetical protein